MAVRFAATMNAINRGLEDLKPEKGADSIEDWEAALSDIDVSGSKGIARDLAALRKQLESKEPNGDRVMALIHRLGEATTKIAEKAPTNQDKLRQLGQALSESGNAQADEEDDVEATANPRRRKAK